MVRQPRFFPIVLLLLTQFIIFSLTSCTHRTVESIRVQVDLPGEAEPLPLQQTPAVEPEQEGQLIEIDGRLRTPQYQIRYPTSFSLPDGTDPLLRITYRATRVVQARFEFESDESLVVQLPATKRSGKITESRKKRIL